MTLRRDHLDAEAELALVNGRIATLDAENRTAACLVVRDGRILEVGSAPRSII